MSMPRQATIFGGDGFIGSHLRARLRGDGWECRVVSRTDAVPRGSDLGAVFYCAGLTADYAERAFDTVRAHTCRLAEVLEHCRFDRLVYLSSTRLYDSQSGPIALESAPLHLDPANPRHFYDLSKALGESLCRVAGAGRACVARLSCVFNDQHDADGFLPALLRQALAHPSANDSPLLVDSSAAYARDYVWMDDVLRALLRIADGGEHLVYNVASGENLCNRDLFAALAQSLDIVIVPRRHDVPQPPPRICIDRMRQEFGWQPLAPLERVRGLLAGAVR